jgi:GNAT superfamily N-acetyltransferase
VTAGIEYDDDPRRVDRDAVWAFLSTEAYWGRWRDRATVEAQLDGAWRLVGAYDAETGRMVGFARTVSDGAHVAYLADVFVVGDRRGEGIGHGLVTAMIDDGPGAHFRWMLHTADATHSLTRSGPLTSPGPARSAASTIV